MLVTVFTVTMLALSVIVLVMMVVDRFVAVVLVLQAEGHSGLVPRCHVKPVLLLKLPSSLVPLQLQLSQSSTDKVLLPGGQKVKVRMAGGSG